jgi:sialic acid synthase SpsE
MRRIHIGKRVVDDGSFPLVIAEIGINHEGDPAKARRMVDDAAAAGCECVKFQCHVIEDEMIPNDVIPGNARESIWDIMARCALSEADDRALMQYAESKGLIYLSTPFSRAAADRLQGMNVPAYKIGSGECNNYPLIQHVARFGKPIILSTGMNDLDSIRPAVDILRAAGVEYALTHCTSMYPTPYDKVRLGAIPQLRDEFPDAVVGLSDHSIGNYTCLAAVALGARILEKHFTSDKSWPGPDVPISMDPAELADLVRGSRAVFEASGGEKTILTEEQPTIDFAYACVVTIQPVRKGDVFSRDNVWVKRPGTGDIKARELEAVLTRRAKRDIAINTQLAWKDIE